MAVNKLSLCIVIVTLLTVPLWVDAKPAPVGIVGDVVDTEVLIIPELSGAMQSSSNIAILPSRLTTANGVLYLIDNDENDSLSAVQRVAKYDEAAGRSTFQWQLKASGAVLRDAVVAADGSSVFLLDNANKSIEKQAGEGEDSSLVTISLEDSLGNLLTNPDTLALDSAGNFYVLDKTAPSAVYKFSASGNYLSHFNGWTDAGGTTALADISDIAIVDIAGSESLYLLQDTYSTPAGNTEVYEFDLSGGFLQRLNAAQTANATFLGASRFSYTPSGSGGNEWYFYTVVNSQNALRVRRTNSGSALWSILAGGLGGSESQWTGISTQYSAATSRLDVAAVSPDKIYVVDRNDGIVVPIDVATTPHDDPDGELANVTDPVGNGESFDELLRATLAQLLGDSSNTTGINFNLLAYDDTTLKTYTGDAETLARTSSELLATDTMPATQFDLDGAILLAKDHIATLLASQGSNSCVDTYGLYIGPGDWDDADDAIDELDKLINNSGYAGIQPLAYNLGVNSDDPARKNLTDLGDAVGLSALFPVTKAELIADLSTFFQDKAVTPSGGVSTRPSLTSQVVTYDIDNNNVKEFGLLKVRFEYDKDSLWRGHIERYDGATNEDVVQFFDSDDAVISPLWDAGKILSERAADDRQLWTVNSAISNDLNNFVVSNLSSLNVDFHPTLSGDDLADAEVRTEKLIRYIRGENVYGEDESPTLTGEREWKLGDTYHAKPVIVGPPNAAESDNIQDLKLESYFRYLNNYSAFKATHAARKRVVYTPSNDGVLHAFDWATGEELWGFVPPGLLAELTQIESGTNGTSRSIFGVDATPVSKDVFLNGQWTTILIGGLGRGGAGYYALDITDPEQPQHLFSIKNDKAAGEVIFWQGFGSKFDLPSPFGNGLFDYSRLGETWSEPVITNIHYNGVRRDVAVLGAGYNGKIKTDVGDRIYVIDLSTGLAGSVLYQGALTDEDDSIDGIVNALPASPVAVTAEASLDPTQYFYGSSIYIGDLEGQIWKLDLSGEIINFTSRWEKIFDGEATADNGRYLFNRIAPTVNSDKELLLTFGTGDADDVSSRSSNINNFFAGFVDESFFNSGVSTTSIAISDLENVTDQNTAQCPIPDAKKGWRFDLKANERLIANSDVLNKNAILTTYTPGVSEHACTNFGSSTYREFSIDCGTPYQEQDLGVGVASEISVLRGRVYIAISTPETSNVEQTLDGDGRWTRAGGVVTGIPSDPDSGGVRIELWQQLFQ